MYMFANMFIFVLLIIILLSAFMKPEMEGFVSSVKDAYNGIPNSHLWPFDFPWNWSSMYHDYPGRISTRNMSYDLRGDPPMFR